MGGSKFSGKRPTTVLDTLKGTKIGVDVSNVHGQTSTGSKAKEDTNKEAYDPKRSNFLNEFVPIHLVLNQDEGRNVSSKPNIIQSTGSIQDAPTLKNTLCVF